MILPFSCCLYMATMNRQQHLTCPGSMSGIMSSNDPERMDVEGPVGLQAEQDATDDGSLFVADGDKDDTDDSAEGSSKSKYSKWSSHVSIAPTSYDCPGPLPGKEDVGRCKLRPQHLRDLLNSAVVLNDLTTTGYLNLLARRWNESPPNGLQFHLTAPDIAMALEGRLEAHGRHDALDQYSEFLEESESAGAFTDLRNDKLIYVQLFEGALGSGHWTGLMIDRTKNEQETAVYFDSLGGDGFKFKNLFSKVGILGPDARWIVASVPRHYGVDSGVYMCCVASLYLDAIRCEDPVGIAGDFDNVDLIFDRSISSSKAWGSNARAHMTRVIGRGSFNFSEMASELECRMELVR